MLDLFLFSTGSMIDTFKSSKPTFWMSAAMYSISAMMMLAVTCLGRRKSRNGVRAVAEMDV